ncbi:MAG: hypothetical protein QXX99_07365 [Candidatus Bathyarchaeia archaeon]
MTLTKFCVLMLALLVISSAHCPSITPIILELKSNNGIFRYEFIVDAEGNAHVKIIYSSDLQMGSSWVLVPRFIKWVNRTIYGDLLRCVIDEPERYTGSQYYFYKVLRFDFTSGRMGFKVVIEYNFPLAAMVVESESTYGIFYSPQIGFDPKNLFEAIVVFPENFRARKHEAIALGKGVIYNADGDSNSSHVLFKNIPVGENLLRIQIGFDLTGGRADTVVLREGIFEFITVARYEKYAQKIIDFYNTAYNALVNIFNVTLDHVGAKFFIPDFHTLMSIGGYIPFSGGRLGDIYINLMFTRYMEGYLEVAALHELAHHFMWKAGIPPEKLLWFHEGMAQFISIEIAESMGYEGGRIIKEDIDGLIRALKLSTRSNLGFLVEWTPYYAPRETEVLYASAYYIISELSEEYGGLEYYSKFFRLFGNVSLESNSMLCYYLSLAANTSLFDKFNSWGFNLPDIYAYRPLIIEVEKAIGSVNQRTLFLQPFRKMAELFYLIAVSGGVSSESTRLFLLAALFVAKFARPIALITYSCILLLVILLMILKSR